jgi:membrane protease YdiL (CAAX protease family)
LPFIPLLIYMLIHVNYFEEFYFRKNVKRVVIWALLHIVMGVAVYVVIVLLPLGFFYRYILDKYSINHAYTLHFATNLVLIGISVSSYFLL